MSYSAKIAGLLCGILASGLTASASTHAARKTKAVKAPAQVEQPVPAIPQPPPTPEQMPATPPRVTFGNGLLSISAENSTLGDVLNAVKNLTGATVDVPPAATSERVVVKLGPGHPQEILQQLFAGSKFDYIILGSPDSPGSVQKIILTARSSAAGSAVAGNNPAPQPATPAYQPPASPDYQADNGVDEEISQPEPAPPQEEVTPPQPGVQGQIGPNGQPMPPEQQGPKTPEQLLQELQRMQQQQQQGRPPRGAVPQ